MLFPGSSTRADQKLVSFKDVPFGKFRINCPSCSCVQYPPITAFDVQMYVFCYEIMSKLHRYLELDKLTGRSSSVSDVVVLPRYLTSPHS